eukprot:12418934-Karenia_brevis.AAC.1
MASAISQGQEIEGHEKARQILHRLLSATNRRMHKGFPEMLSYLLRRPMEYSSHTFVALSVDNIFRILLARVYAKIGQSTPKEGSGKHTARTSMTTKKPLKLTEGDYFYRPSAMFNFPLYFFIAGCEARRKADGNTLQWVELEERQLTGGMAGPPDFWRPSLHPFRFPREPGRWGEGNC